MAVNMVAILKMWQSTLFENIKSYSLTHKTLI